MSNTKHTLFLIFIFFLGVIFGKLNNPSVSTETVHLEKESISSSKKENEVQINTVKNEHKIERYYKNGKILKEIILGSNISNFQSNISSEENRSSEKNVQDSYKTYNSKPNWLVGTYLPINSIKTPTFNDVSIQVGYRIIGNIYITGSSTMKLQNPMVGLQITF